MNESKKNRKPEDLMIETKKVFRKEEREEIISPHLSSLRTTAIKQLENFEKLRSEKSPNANEAIDSPKSNISIHSYTLRR